MAEKLYNFVLTGDTSLLMHADAVDYARAIDAWRKVNKNSERGSDMSPAWTWMSYLYKDAEDNIMMPWDNLAKMLTAAGSKVKSTGRSTYKTAIASYLQPSGDSDGCKFEIHTEVDGAVVWKQLNIADFKGVFEGQELPLEEINDFPVHAEAVRQQGFELFVKRAKIGESKHVRVRPKFKDWRVSGQFVILDPEESGLTLAVLTNIFKVAGQVIGLCDWRPSSPTPGFYGKFHAELTPVANN